MLEVGRDRGQGLCVDGGSGHGRVEGTLGGDGEGGSGGGALMRGPRRPVRGKVVEMRRGLRRFRDLDDGGRGRIWDTLVAISLVLPGFHETRRYHHGRHCQLMGEGGGGSASGDKAKVHGEARPGCARQTAGPVFPGPGGQEQWGPLFQISARTGTGNGEGNVRTALAAVLVDIEAVWVVVGMRSRLDESIAHFSREP